MADSIVRLRVDSQEYDNKLKRAAEGLNRYIEGCRKAGGTLEYVDDGVKEFAKSLGNMDTVAGGAKGKLGEMTKAFTDLTMQFNAMTEAEKRGQFGKALSSGLDELKQRIISTKQELADINNSLNGGGSSGGGGLFGGGKLDGMLQVFGGNLMTKGAGMLAGLASEMGDMITQGIELARQGEGIRIAFERLGRGDILDGLRRATHGTVTDIELMKAAVKFNDFKLPVEELGTMLAFAQQKAKDTGQSVDYMVDSIVTGLGRKSLLILDNLGLSAAEIKERMAETGDMTKAVGAIIRDQMAKAGDYVETAADRATQANVSLQNKMEELGRKFLPVKQASDDLWTSIKIGILNIVGGPLADLLNGLTRAGQLRNELKNIGSDERVNSDIAKLKGSNYKDKVYAAMLNKYSREEQLSLDNYKKAQRGGMGSIAIWENRYLAKKTMREDFQRRGSEVVNGTNKPVPVQITNPTTTTGGTTTTTTTHQTPQQRAQEGFTKAEQNYKQALEQAAMELKAGTINQAQAKQKEMQAAEQRWKAIGDARNIADSPKLQQAQVEAADIYQKLAAEVKTATERQKAIDKATRDLENANQKLADARSEMAAAEHSGDRRAYYAAEKKATTAQQEVTRLETVKVNVERGKVDLPNIPEVIKQTVNTHQGELMTAEIAKDITQTINTRLGRIVTPDILESITQTINTQVGRVVTPEIAKEVTQVVNVEQGRVQLPDIPTEDKTIHVNIEATTSNLDAEIANMKDKMSQLAVGSDAFNLDLAKMVDFTTLKTLINEQVKNGLTIDPEASQKLMNQIINGENITDETWQNLIDEINKKLKELGIDTIKIDFGTGETSKKGREKKNPFIQTDEKGNEKSSLAGVMGGIGTGMSEMVSGMENLGIEIPKGFKDTISAVQGVVSILNSIVVIVKAIEAISAIDSILPFARGGIVHAAGGYVPGNTYSGDQIPAMLNAGEVVLNRGQQGVLAASLQAVGQSGEGGGGGRPYVSGELIWLGLKNYLNRSGRGEIVTSRRK